MILQRRHQSSAATDVSARDSNYYQKLIASFRWKKLGSVLPRCSWKSMFFGFIPGTRQYWNLFQSYDPQWSSMIIQTVIEAQKIRFPSEALLIEWLMFHMFHEEPCCFVSVAIFELRTSDKDPGNVMRKRPGCCNLLCNLKWWTFTFDAFDQCNMGCWTDDFMQHEKLEQS